MMWFDRADPRALFIDKRQEVHPMNTTARSAGRNPAVIAPDVVASFTAMPFPDESFYVVVFDPPHIKANRAGKSGRSVRFTACCRTTGQRCCAPASLSVSAC
jgi:hypothetical protein